VVISSVAYGGPADQSGLIRGDIILEIDRKAIHDVADFYSLVAEKKSYLLRILRPSPQGSHGFMVIVLDLKNSH
jgi:S1-C subfamily serine protease